MNITLVIIGIFGLWVGGNWLVMGLPRLAHSLGFSGFIVSLTLLPLVTAGPELLVAINATRAGAGDLLIGALVGSNIANIGLILGLSGLLNGRMEIASRLVRRGIPLLLVASIMVYALLWLPQLGVVVGVLLVVSYVAFNALMLTGGAAAKTLVNDMTLKMSTTEVEIVSIETTDVLLQDASSVAEDVTEYINRWVEFVRVLAGIALLLFASDAIVDSALSIVNQLGTNQVILGVVLLSTATALPELIAVLSAANAQEDDVAVASVIGSSVANLLLVLGVAALVQPIVIGQRALMYELPAMIVFTLILIPVARDGVLSLREAAFYVALYVAFLVGVFMV